MKTIILTDGSTNLDRVLFEQYEFYLVENERSPFGQIIYSVDKLLSAGFNIIYLTNSLLYDKLACQFDKMSDIHSNNFIKLVNIDSALVGKNNIALKILTSTDLEKTLKTYKLQSESFIGETMECSPSLISLFN